MTFHDRAEAGRRLAEALEPYRSPATVVLGIPRGGVAVAAEVARALGAQLDVIVARKAGAPDQPELAIGAVAPDGTRYMNEDLVAGLGLTDAKIDAAFDRAKREAREREDRFRAGRPALALRGRTVIVVDDGIATGATLRSALRSARRARPARLVAAVPVAPSGSRSALRNEADEVVVVEESPTFMAVGQFYEKFAQVSDDEVTGLLAAAEGVVVR